MTNLKTLTSVHRNHPNQKCLSMIGRWQNRQPKVPAGLILPFNDSTIPDGWTRFNNADDRMIVGAGSTYSIGDEGGSTSVSLSSTLSSGGSHPGNYHGLSLFGSTDGLPETYGPIYGYNTTSGAHTHNLTEATYDPSSNVIILIKANSELYKLPTNAVVLSDGNFNNAGFSNVFNNDKFLCCGSSLTSKGSTNITTDLSTSGSHVHEYYRTIRTVYQGTTIRNYYNYDGNHSGSINIPAIDNLKKVLVSLWTNASLEFNIKSKMIGMYESLTPPEGWVLCDGNNGTPDLRDYFIKSVSGGNELSGSGTNTLNINYSGSTSGHYNGHSHSIGSGVGGPVSGYFGYITNSHSHSININTSIACLPPYYSLAFIMRS